MSLSSLRVALLALFGLLLGCLLPGTTGALATGEEDRTVVKWQAPRMRPPAFGRFPTKSTQKVIHVGYPKTGTVSLAKVIDHFGLSHLHGNLGYQPDDWSGKSRMAMEDVLGGVDAWMEMLGRFELDKLLALYPKAKYILTTRDADAWYRSATRFFEGSRMGEEYFIKHFGSADFGDAETWKSHFTAHIERVKQTIPSEQLLVIDLTSGNSTENLQKLCRFVEVVECPAGGMPHEHSTDKVLEKRSEMTQRRLQKQEETSDSLEEAPERAYVTMISAQSKTLDVDIQNVKVWAMSFVKTGTKYGLLCAVVDGHLTARQEQDLGLFVSLSYPSDSLDLDMTVPMGVEDTAEARLEMSKTWLAALKVKALMYMAPETLALQNLDSRIEEFAESGLAFESMRNSSGTLVPGAFMLAPGKFRAFYQVVKTRSWSPSRGWLSMGPAVFDGVNLSSWDFSGSAGGFGLFLSGCVAGSPTTRRGGCSFTAIPEALCTAPASSHCKEARATAETSLDEEGSVRKLGWSLKGYSWSSNNACLRISTYSYNYYYRRLMGSTRSTETNTYWCENRTSTTTTTTTSSSTSSATSTTTSTSSATSTTTSTSTATSTTSSTSSATSTTTSTSTATSTTSSTSTATTSPVTTTTTSTSTATSTTTSTTTATTFTSTTSTSTTQALYLTMGLTFNDIDIFESALIPTSPSNGEVNNMLMTGFGVIDEWSAKRIESLSVMDAEGRNGVTVKLGTVTYWYEMIDTNCTLDCAAEQINADFLRTVNSFAASSTYLKDLRVTSILQIGDLESVLDYTDSAPAGGLPILAVLMAAVAAVVTSLRA